jgi:hypothetical protein
LNPSTHHDAEFFQKVFNSLHVGCPPSSKLLGTIPFSVPALLLAPPFLANTLVRASAEREEGKRDTQENTEIREVLSCDEIAADQTGE